MSEAELSGLSAKWEAETEAFSARLCEGFRDDPQMVADAKRATVILLSALRLLVNLIDGGILQDRDELRSYLDGIQAQWLRVMRRFGQPAEVARGGFCGC